jgi:hypothetical protein
MAVQEIGESMDTNKQPISIMLSHIVSVKKDDMTYQFILPSASSWGSAVDAAYMVFLQLDAERTATMEKIKKEKEEKTEAVEADSPSL